MSDYGFEHVAEPETLPEIRDVKELNSSVVTSDLTPVTGSSWNSLLAHAFSANLNLATALPLPWETGTMRDIFSDDVLPAFAPAVVDSTDLSRKVEAACDLRLGMLDK